METCEGTVAGKLGMVLDYSVLDHLRRIDTGTYSGLHGSALERLRSVAIEGRIAVWIAEISYVEMIHGIEKLADNKEATGQARQKDAQKRAIADRMHAGRLGYPCSKFDDTYSRWDVSFRFAGPDSDRASALEARLESVQGISAGDARQLVCCAYPFNGDDVKHPPHLDWFLSEDRALVGAVVSEIQHGRLHELAGIRFGTSEDIGTACPAILR